MNATHQPDTLHDKTISTITEEPHGTTPDGKLSDCAPNAKRFQFSSFSDAKSADSKKYLGRKLIPASVTGSRISSDKACDWGNSGGARELRAGSSGATGSTRGESSFRTAVDADAHGSKGEDAASKDATSERCRNGTVALWEDRNQAWNYPQLATTDGEALMPAQSIYLLRQAVNRLNVIASTAERQKLSLPSVLVEPKRRRVRSGFQLRSAESAVGSQLSRFLQVLATADSRIAESLLKGEPGGRFRFVDARRLQDNTLQPQDTLHTISKCWDELSAMAHAHFAWLARLTQLNEFCEATGVLPSRQMPDVLESKLATWMNNLRRNIRKGLLAPEHLVALQKAHPRVLRRVSRWVGPDYWTLRLNELEMFIKRNGKHPQTGNGTQFERSFALWAWSQQDCMKKGSLRIDKREQIIKVLNLTGSFDAHSSTSWTKWCDELQAYIHTSSALQGSKFFRLEISGFATLASQTA
ncbi:unnamed protein product [Polarella glacialis]|uniref:Helicase-associated domain-containing protein n=1 Tax=Polarella glacialis TaxID=89957 RepID=A0A813HJ65_POLGL|nr:unnamed protein product [Polarella glacialis]